MTGGPTGIKAVTKEIAYSAKLFVDDAVWTRMTNRMFSLEKVTSGSVQTVFPAQQSPGSSSGQPVDLLDMGSADLRLVIEDNTGSDNRRQHRDRFYQAYNRAILNIAVPLRLEVNKVVGPSNKPTEAVKNDEVEVVLEILDPPEMTSIVNGPKHKSNPSPKTGEGFLKLFAKELKKDQPAVSDDNCIDQFASRFVRRKCRRLNERIKASNILYTSGRRRHAPLMEDTAPNQHRARIKINESGQSGHLEGTANFFFCPPLILGDNYRLKITLVDAAGKPVILKDNKYALKLSSFQTPVLTIWKKVRIHMLVHQYSANINKLVWSEVINAFNDAFTIVEKPLPQRVIPIPMPEWMDYLGRVVYRPFRKPDWDRYKVPSNATVHSGDFGSFSFPQRAPLTPEDDKPNHGPATWTTWDLLGKLANRIVSDKLLAQNANPIDGLGAVNWGRFRSPSRGRSFGLCLMMCKTPSPRSGVGGAYIGNKVFYIAEVSDTTLLFAHEMGHSVFLNHAATKFELATTAPGVRPLRVDAPLVLRSEVAGEEGPYFDEHRSEDMIPCAMSYRNHYYDASGNRRPNTNPARNWDHPVDWHFCGVCLLKLRFYEIPEMQTSNATIFRRIQYTKTKTAYPRYHDDPNRPPLKIAILRGMVNDNTSGALISRAAEVSIANSTTIKMGRSMYILALYPQEGSANTNNQDLNCYKDLSFLAGSKSLPIGGRLKRMEWVSSNPRKAYVRSIYVRRAKMWISILKGRRLGSTRVTFKINISRNESLESDPLTVTVTS